MIAHGVAKLLARFGVLFVLLGGLSPVGQAETVSVRLPSPPETMIRFTPGPNGLVSILLDLENQASDTPTTVSVLPFWTADRASHDVLFVGDNVTNGGRTTRFTAGQPLALNAGTIPSNQIAWGYLTVVHNGMPINVSVVFGNFGPAIVDGPGVTATPNGRARVIVDIRQHRPFGSTARFTLTPFHSGGNPTDVTFMNPAQEGNDANTADVQLPPDDDTIALEIDASTLDADTEYEGKLRTTIDGHTFIDTRIVLTKQAWDTAGVTFANIDESTGSSVIALSVGATGGKTIRGFHVADVKGTTDDFAPKDDLKITLDGEELWPADARKVSKPHGRTLQPSVAKEVLVTTTRELSPGSYEATVVFGGTNVSSKDWAEGKVTFLKKYPAYYAVLVLIGAVLLSYMSTKGIATMLHRRDLRQRIKNIRRKSWLRDDRWGALPIVRAFGRAAMADKALRLERGFRFFSRFVTAPQLIADEVTEVEERLEILERLNRLAIYWQAAPSANGLTVSGLDPMIVRRAQKKLRLIVDRFGQVQEGDDVGAHITSEIESLESWENREQLMAGYWASLRDDAQALLDSIQISEFAFDSDTRNALLDRLQDLLESTPDDSTLKTHLSATISACRSSDHDGVGVIRETIEPILDQTSAGDWFEETLRNLENCDREIVRGLAAKITPGKTPDSLNDMIGMERNYARLKLIWEQRRNKNWRQKLIDCVKNNEPLDDIFDILDGEVWERLKKSSAVRIKSPESGEKVEQYALTNFAVECTDKDANTFLFKHGLEYRWTICWGGKKLTPTTRSTMVTQFIPDPKMKVAAQVTMWYGKEQHPVDAISFETIETKRFRNLWPTHTSELIGLGIALILALLAGFQSDAFEEALNGSWKEWIALIAWGVGADQTKNLLQNITRMTKGGEAT